MYWFPIREVTFTRPNRSIQTISSCLVALLPSSHFLGIEALICFPRMQDTHLEGVRLEREGGRPLTMPFHAMFWMHW